MANYEEKYKKALAAAVKFKENYPDLWNENSNPFKDTFSELTESKEEKIRKAIIALIKQNKTKWICYDRVSLDEMLTWLDNEKTIKVEDYHLKDTWEYIDEFVKKFGRLPKDIDELSACVDFVIEKHSKYEWSEKDDAIMTDLLKLITEQYNKLEIGSEKFSVLEKWIKSSRTRITYKPTVEQLKRLHNAIGICKGVNEHTDASYLKSLYEDLIKLM